MQNPISVDNTANIISSYNKTKLTATGTTNYNDKIDMPLSDYAPTGATNIKKNKGLTINGGAGNDEIKGANYNDTITGGKGENTVNIDVNNIKDICLQTLFIAFLDNLKKLHSLQQYLHNTHQNCLCTKGL